MEKIKFDQASQIQDNLNRLERELELVKECKTITFKHKDFEHFYLYPKKDSTESKHQFAVKIQSLVLAYLQQEKEEFTLTFEVL